jgi:DNA-binding protein
MELLESQGFRYRNCVDILDAGPSIEAVVSEVETVRNSFMATVAIDDAALGSDGEKWLVANPALDNFSCTETQLAKGVEVGNGGWRTDTRLTTDWSPVVAASDHIADKSNIEETDAGKTIH